METETSMRAQDTEAAKQSARLVAAIERPSLSPASQASIFTFRAPHARRASRGATTLTDCFAASDSENIAAISIASFQASILISLHPTLAEPRVGTTLTDCFAASDSETIAAISVASFAGFNIYFPCSPRSQSLAWGYYSGRLLRSLGH